MDLHFSTVKQGLVALATKAKLAEISVPISSLLFCLAAEKACRKRTGWKRVFSGPDMGFSAAVAFYGDMTVQSGTRSILLRPS